MACAGPLSLCCSCSLPFPPPGAHHLNHWGCITSRDNHSDSVQEKLLNLRKVRTMSTQPEIRYVLLRHGLLKNVSNIPEQAEVLLVYLLMR